MDGILQRIYRDFSGGHNDGASEFLISPTEGQHKNTNLDPDGTVRKRLGALKANASPTGVTDEFGLIWQFRPWNGSAEWLAAYGTKLSSWSGTAFTELKTGLTANKVMLAAAFRTVAYFQNNADDPLVYCPSYAGGGSKVWRPGTPQPGSNPAWSANIAGSMSTGTIKVRVRFVSPVDDVFFGEPAPNDANGISLTVTASGGVRITIPTYAGTDHKVAKRLIERTTVGGGIFFFDGLVADNSTTTYDITQADTALIENEWMPDPGFRLVMPKLWPFCAYGNRIVGFDPTELGRLVWSEIDEFGVLPEAFPVNNWHRIQVCDAEDEPRMMLPFDRWLVVFCGRSTHLLYIDETGRAESQRLTGWGMGVAGPRAGVETPFGLFVWTYKGPYLYDGGSLPIPLGERIDGTVRDLDSTQLAGMYAIHREDRRQVKFVIPGPDDAAKNSLAAIYHYRRAALRMEGFPLGHAWTFHDGFTAKSGAMGRTTAHKDVEYSGSYDGYLYTEDIGGKDEHGDGKINGVFTTAWLDLDRPDLVKDFTDAWVVLGRFGTETVTLSWQTDFDEGPSGSEPMQATAGDDLIFDEGTWDDALWGGGASRIYHARLANDGVSARGRLIRLAFSSNAQDEDFRIIAVILRATPGGVFDDDTP